MWLLRLPTRCPQYTLGDAFVVCKLNSCFDATLICTANGADGVSATGITVKNIVGVLAARPGNTPAGVALLFAHVVGKPLVCSVPYTPFVQA